MPVTTMRGQVRTESCGCEQPVCPECGGLECLCRPRFFAGQLLTDEDLQRLDRYITAKNKLHNRYLMGWGVACGLEVVCSPCDGGVTVRPGYALSPCGDDIVLCNETAVDVCALIQQCRKREPGNCLPNDPANDPCSGANEKWILSIHYDEKTSRGVAPLKNTGGAACCSKCACGGSSSCGCRCHAKARASTSANGACACSGKTVQPTPQCEPTVVCEGYRFQVCKVVKDPPAPRGLIIERFLCCYSELSGLVAAPPQDPALLQDWCCTIRDNLLEFFAANPGYTCAIPDQLTVLCKSGADPATIKTEVASMLAQFLHDCLCSLFLPPCPCPVEDSDVPLATITISRKNGTCRVVSICNLDVRKFLTTFPTLGYWLSELPLARNLRKLLSNLCCAPPRKLQVSLGNAVLPSASAFMRRSGAAGGAGAAENETGDFARLAALAYARRGRPADIQALALASLGLTDANNAPFLTSFELAHPLETLVLNQLGVPVINALVAGAAGGAVGIGAPPAPEAAQPDLRSEVELLRARLTEAMNELDRLAGRIRGEG